MSTAVFESTCRCLGGRGRETALGEPGRLDSWAWISVSMSRRALAKDRAEYRLHLSSSREDISECRPFHTVTRTSAQISISRSQYTGEAMVKCVEVVWMLREGAVGVESNTGGC